MRKTFLYAFFSILLTQCTKEEVGLTKTFIINTTNHRIRILPFNGSNLDNIRIKLIEPLATVEVYSASVKGKTIDPCYGTLLQPFDSVVVTYDDTIRIPYIKFNLVYSGTHRILFSSNRSISNAANYIKAITRETKTSLEGNFTYTFTEQDYLDAK